MGLPATHLDEVDKIQFTRFEVSVHNQHQSKTSSEVELDYEPLILTTVDDIQALLGAFDDELKEDSDEDVFEAGEEMVEDIQEPETEETQTHSSTETPNEEPLSTEHQSPLPNKDQPKSSRAKKTNASNSESSSCSKTLKPYNNYIPIIERQLATGGLVIYENMFDHRDQTDKLVKKTMNHLDKISQAGVNERAKLLKTLNRVSETLELTLLLKKQCKRWLNQTIPPLATSECANISNSLKDDPQFNQRLLKAAKGYIQNFTRLTEIANSLHAIHFPNFHQRITVIENTQGEQLSIVETTKEVETEHVEKDPEVEDVKMEPEHQPQLTGLVIDITPPEQPESPQATPKPDRGKGKVTDDAESPPKLVKSSSKVHPDPNAPILVPYEIHGKMY
ncbi:hypothetical protein Tco_0933089 [Tanacetum coccineum]